MTPGDAPLYQCVCSTANFVSFNSHGRKIDEKSREVIAVILSSTDKIEKEDVAVEHHVTNELWAEYNIKPLQEAGLDCSDTISWDYLSLWTKYIR